MNTIYIDNKKNISDLSGLDKTQNDIGKSKVLIHSNDNNILLQNNLIQLNLDNNKHSYNYPLVIYKTDKTQSENNFNKIAQTFQSNNSNVMQNFEFNFPDKISMINVSGSNFINMNLNPDNDNMDINTEKAGNISKGIKIHDYIRQEEKESITEIVKNILSENNGDPIEKIRDLFSSGIMDDQLDNINCEILKEDYPEYDLSFKVIVIGDSGI